MNDGEPVVVCVPAKDAEATLEAPGDMGLPVMTPRPIAVAVGFHPNVHTGPAEERGYSGSTS